MRIFHHLSLFVLFLINKQLKYNESKDWKSHYRIARGAKGVRVSNWNDVNDKNVTKSLSFLQFQFFLAS